LNSLRILVIGSLPLSLARFDSLPLVLYLNPPVLCVISITEFWGF